MKTFNQRQQEAIFLALSRALTYPDELLLSQNGAIFEFLGTVSAEIAADYLGFHDWLVNGDLLHFQESYVETFDQKRSSCLYLTFFLNGDTRKRGMALWRFANVYREHGYELTDGELPDYLPALLNFTATKNFESGLHLLQSHQRAIAVLFHSLETQISPYKYLLGVLMKTLPPLTAADLKSAEELINSGPPEESVGLEGYNGPVSISIGVRP